ncbi:MAG: S1 RNA-binding domain-containing protein, partial [Ruminococcus sp.]|uniref:S1 RNA-binding domain-containing protein n=1 Tax=Ruminococcus sp. TaxID=41978 RepID=UPI001B27F8A7
MKYRPEGFLYNTDSNSRYLADIDGLTKAMEKSIILEGKVTLCTSSHDLIVELPCAKGIISREEGAIGIKEGKTRDIALISRVNKIVCFKVRSMELDESGEVIAVLSRKAAQEECRRNYILNMKKGDIIEAKVTHLEQFGCFVDIGCGIPSLIPIDA